MISRRLILTYDMTADNPRFQQAIQKIDQANSSDPNQERSNGKEYPKELLYSQRMSECLLDFEPHASESLQLAARAQHICRWTIPRESYPMDRKGYLQWRTELKRFHAEKSEEILIQSGYDQDTVNHVKSLILKQRLKTDPESQALEDVVCLVFLEYYFRDFAAKHKPEKVVSILQKTWNKMSEKGQQKALTLDYTKEELHLINKAINPSDK